MIQSLTHKRWLLRYRWLIVPLILLPLVICAGGVGTRYLSGMAKQEITRDNESAISILSSHWTDELKRFEGAVRALAGSPWIAPALIFRRYQDIVNANSVLDRYNSAIDASVSYLMDSTGMTIASSNRNASDSFVGQSYQFRPYFVQSMQGKAGRYFALGVTSAKKGFYASFPVQGPKGNIIGVAAIKKDLDGMEAEMNSYPYCFFINKHGIIFLSCKREMLLKSLWPIDQKTQQALIASKQFGEKPFDVVMSQEVFDGMTVTFEGARYLVSRRVIDSEGWSIILMAPTDRIMIYKAAGIIITTLICLIMVILIVFNYRASKSADRLAKQNRELEILNETKDRFLGIAAHDLRNPLIVVNVSAKLLQQRTSEPAHLTLLNNMSKAASKMLDLINNLLDVSKIRTGKIEINPEEVNIAQFLKECFAENEMIGKQKDIALVLSVPADIGCARFDKERMHQAVDNLLSNAFKYSHPNTTVTLGARRSGRGFEIWVEDQGVGIKDEDLPKLFEEFSKASAQPTAGESSHGLGLAIVKRVVELQGGRIEAKSKLGGGAIFTITLG